MSTSKYPNEIKINPNKGGKAAIERLVEAYGFTTRQALADHLKYQKALWRTGICGIRFLQTG